VVASRALASDRISPADWDAAHARLVECLRDLIRIPSINPPDPAGPELDAARYLAGALGASGIPSTVFEPVPGRGSVVARLRGDGTGGAPLLLLSHLDVVPAPPERWTHDPFAADVDAGWVYGRGAVDMKNLVAMELEVLRLLAAGGARRELPRPAGPARYRRRRDPSCGSGSAASLHRRSSDLPGDRTGCPSSARGCRHPPRPARARAAAEARERAAAAGAPASG